MMGITIDKLYKTAKYKDKKDAHEDAALIQSGDDEWTYKVKKHKSGKFAIAIYDDEGVFVDYWKTIPRLANR